MRPPTPRHSTVAELKDTWTVNRLAKQKFTVSEMRTGGVTLEAFRKGYNTWSDLVAERIFTASELTDAGFDLKELMRTSDYAKLAKVGFTVKELLEAGGHRLLTSKAFPVKVLKAHGYKAQELKRVNRPFDELLQGGYSLQEIKDAGYPADDFAATFKVRKAGFTVTELKDTWTVKRLAKQNYTVNEM